MFTIYSEKEIFENITIYDDKYPNWHKILCGHSQICLNLTDKELEDEEIPGTVIFEFINALGGKRPIALKDYFNNIYEDNSLIIDKPRSVFFLNYPKTITDTLQKDIGVIVQSSDEIDDNILYGTFYRELPKDFVVENGTNIGWKELLNFPLTPSNSIVISDDYLFKNEEFGKNVGICNLIALLDSILPETINVEYQILIITQDHNKSQKWCEKFAGDLKATLVRLRKYKISVEIVFSESIHKRKVILNYLSLICDKGFAVFRVNDLKTVRSENDFRIEKFFNRMALNEGDSEYKSSEINLIQIKKICESTKQFINNSKSDINKRILGDCKKDKSINNRLLNDV
jgi:hypothetical protein